MVRGRHRGSPGPGPGLDPGAPGTRGFTLVETTVAVAIVALVMAVTIPAVSNITQAELRASASKLSGLVKSTYDRAALTGETYRLTFDFESRQIGVEATQESLAFEEGGTELAKRQTADDLGLGNIMRIGQEVAMASMLGEELATEDLAETVGAAAFGGGGEDDGESPFGDGATGLNLSEGVHLLDVWVQGMGEPVAEGKAYLYFFPHGYTQDAIIHLEDEDNRVFAVKISALTGRTRMAGEYLEAKK